MTLGSLTFDEIVSQPQSWRVALGQCAALASRWREAMQSPAEQTLYVGCGTSYYLAQAAAAADRAISGRRTLAVPASELLLFDELYVPAGQPTRMVLISRSGTTTEIVRVAEKFARHRQAETLAITCRSASALAAKARVTFAFDAAFDHSVVMTRSFSTMLLALISFAHLSAGSGEQGKLVKLGDAGERLIDQAAPVVERLGRRGLTKFVFLGQGPLFGIAQEASLKMKEMSLSVSEPFHSLEERHGPKSVVDAQTLVVLLTSERTARWEKALAEELRGLGATCLEIGEGDVTTGEHIGFNSGLGLYQRLPLYIVPCQLLALAQARNKGVDPDHPRALAPVVAVELPID